MAATSDCKRIVSGGQEGEVRVWKIGQLSQTMEASLKEHRGRVNDLRVSEAPTTPVTPPRSGRTTSRRYRYPRTDPALFGTLRPSRGLSVSSTKHCSEPCFIIPRRANF